METYGNQDEHGNWDGLIGELVNRWTANIFHRVINIFVLCFRRADFGMGAISVMAERESVIDFTVPYYDLVRAAITIIYNIQSTIYLHYYLLLFTIIYYLQVGITILMKKVNAPTNLFKFLSVLETSVWGCILGAYFVTSVLLWAFDRWSPYSYQNNMKMYEVS